MNMNLYCVFDKIANNIVCSFSAPNDGLAVRENVVALSKVCPLGDLELRRVGEIDTETTFVKPLKVEVISWESYRFPESPLKPVPKSELQKEGLNPVEVVKK